MNHDEIVDGAMKLSASGWSDRRVFAWIGLQVFRAVVMGDRTLWLAIALLTWTFAANQIVAVIR